MKVQFYLRYFDSKFFECQNYLPSVGSMGGGTKTVTFILFPPGLIVQTPLGQDNQEPRIAVSRSRVSVIIWLWQSRIYQGP